MRTLILALVATPLVGVPGRAPRPVLLLVARWRMPGDRKGTMLAQTVLLSLCLTAAVLHVSAGLSAAFELTQVRTTHYGWLSNRCENDRPGDCISIKGQTQNFRANLSSHGSFEHPTTLAVAASCLHGWRICPTTRSGYLRAGDLAFVPELGWFRVEDTCGACEAGQSNEGAIALWTATASGTGTRPTQLDQRRPTIQVFHPKDPIPGALKSRKANPNVWQPVIWTDVQSMTGARAASLFVDLQLKRITAPALIPSPTPALTTAPPPDATKPAESSRSHARPQDSPPQEAETTDGTAAVDWLLNHNPPRR
jgi:hypothetical protein